MSIRHWHQRVCVQTFAAWLCSSVALAAVADNLPSSITVPEMFGILAAFVVVLGGSLLAMLTRWLRHAGQTVARQRDDAPALERIERRISGVHRAVQDVGREVVTIRDRTSRIEGQMAMLDCVRGQACPPRG